MASPVFSILWEQLKALKPSFLSKKPHFNFITVHYFWIVGMSFLLSIILYFSSEGEMAYIDALFFGAAANTQAGLNPIDVNLLSTVQQVIIMIFSMVSNPIAINSFVVFLRLFWFEKKFQDLVRAARNRRGTISKTRSKARADAHDVERGVNGRHIRVMHGGTPQRITNDGFVLGQPNVKVASSSTDGEDISPTRTPIETAEPSAAEQRGITFAGVVKRSDGMDDTALRIAPRRDEEHIAILQRQRNTENDDVLRIPGPRDVELGERPRRVEGGDSDDAEPLSPGRPPRRRDSDAGSPPPDRPKITIQEPEKHTRPSRKEELGDDARAFLKVFSPFKIRRSRAAKGTDDPLDDHLHGVTRRNTFDRIRGVLSRDKSDREEDEAPYLSFQPTMGRNSQFVGELTDEEREELGGIEYRSLKTLAVILTIYFWGFWILGIAMLTPWIIYTDTYGKIVDAVGQNRAWWGVFTSNSAFTDLGYTLTPDSMNSFNTAVFPLLAMSFFIVIGNTGFPIMLRFIIWVSSHLVPRGTGLWEELRFLLDHPRRCFTLLFPAAATWWLFWLLVLLNGLDLIFFIVLDLGSGVVADLPTGIKILDGVFQAFSTRTAGFSVVNLSLLHPGVQTSYMIMMYISIFPIAISVRRTNVYEEKSLGIYHGGEDRGDEEEPAAPLSYVGSHLRRQLSFDLWYIFIGFFIISISEGDHIQNNEFSMFAALFEIVSAYGTVGLSLGYTGINASLSSQFSVIGKLVIIAMQVRGRHRGLPYGLDRAVLLPSETRFRKEAEESAHGALPSARALPRRNSGVSVATGASVHRGRSRSRDFNRANSNVLVRMLHPGPAVPPPPPTMRRYTTDGTSYNRDDGEPGFASHRSIPTQTDTYSVHRRSVINTQSRE